MALGGGTFTVAEQSVTWRVHQLRIGGFCIRRTVGQRDCDNAVRARLGR